MTSPSIDFSSPQFYSFLLDNITSGVFIANEKFRLTSVNNSFTTIFEKNDERMLLQICGNAMGCASQVEGGVDCGQTKNCGQCVFRNSVIQSIKEFKPIYKQPFVREFYINSQKVEKCFLFSVKPVLFDNTKYAMAIFDDITDLWQREQKLIELNEVKNKFINMATHDLRAPIGHIKIFSGFIKDAEGDLSDEEMKEFVDIIYKQSNHSLNLINDLFDISTVEAGQIALKKEALVLADLVQDRVSIHELFAKTKGLSLIYNNESADKLILADKGRITQVIDNLIENAIKYSFPNNEINIKTFIKEESLCMAIKDAGPGIKEEEISQIFIPFKKTSNLPTGGEKSTGLGLSIVKSIVEVHKGKIYVKSDLGHGCTFFVELPLI